MSYFFVHPRVHMYRMRALPLSANRTTGQPEGIRNRAVEFTDDLIDPFLPAGVAVSPRPNGRVKLPQSHVRYLDEPLRHLQTEEGALKSQIRTYTYCWC